MTDGTEIRKTIVIDAQPEEVFRALTDEKELTSWFPDQAKMESRIGGKVQFKFYRGENPNKQEDIIEGKINELIPNKKLSYSWNNAKVPDFPNTVVTWTIEEVEKNKSRVTVVHTGFDEMKNKELYDMHNGGWSYFIERLAKKF